MPTLIAALAAILISCNTASTPMKAIRLKLTTDGGFTGRGLGRIAVNGEKATTERCDGTITSAERDQLASAIARAEKLTWKESYGHAAPDAVQWTLEVDDRKSSWYDNNDVPKEIDELRQEAWKVRERVNGDCR